MTKSTMKIKILGATILLSALSIPSIASAQLDDAWSFSNQNRASIAALMKQIEDKKASQSVVASGGGDIINLVCGGDGQSSAQANSSCIILNGSNAAIDLGQDSEGDQTATNEETTNVDETINTGGNVDDILDTLNGNL